MSCRSGYDATFSQLMEQVLTDLVWKYCLVFLDDIITVGSMLEESLRNLRLVFERLRTANLKLKPKKCELFRTHV